MAVYERRYTPYEDTLTPRKTRFLVLPAYSYKEILASKMFLVFLSAWGFYALLLLPIFIYLPHNLGFLENFGVDPESVKSFFNYDAKFFFWRFMVPSMIVSYLSALVVGPALVSADLRNNGLPLYLARPFGRWDRPAITCSSICRRHGAPMGSSPPPTNVASPWSAPRHSRSTARRPRRRCGSASAIRRAARR